jgi:glycosyltransferase involved in cell wall biosynthesis
MPDPMDRPAIANEPISVVLTAYNAEVTLPDVIQGWAGYLTTLNRPFEIILVNDGSSDRTREMADCLAGKQPRLVPLHHPTPAGVGATLRTGLTAACDPLVAYAACSPAYEPASLGKLLEIIDQVDLAAGVREWEGPKRSLKELALQWLVRWIFGVRLRDPDCPFKLFRRSILARIPIQSDGPFVHREILAKANFLGCLIAEVPVPYRHDLDSNAKHIEPRPTRAEALHLFRDPDFGPTELPAQPASPAG